MSRFAAKVTKAVAVFEKVKHNLNKVLEEGYQELNKIADKQAELDTDRKDVEQALESAKTIKQKVEEIVGA